MSDVVGIPGNRIRSFVERIEQIENEIKELNEAKKEVFSEAKGEGFDVKILKEIIKLRRQDQDERDEHESLLDVYMRAMDEAGRRGGLITPESTRRREGRLRRGGLLSHGMRSRPTDPVG